MYRIKITYDTGDSFHQEHDVEGYLNVKFSNPDKAKKALKDIESHYKFYMMLHKEWNADKKDKEKAKRIAEKSDWYSKEYSEHTILIENDDGNRVSENCFWCGYFESLVGADVESDPEHGLSFRTRRY